MKKLTFKSKQQTGLIAKLFLMFVFLTSIQSFGQSGFQISWDGSVACQSLLLDPIDPVKKISLEDIPETACVKVCENKEVNFIITSNAVNFTMTWEVAGGTVLNTTNNSTLIQWGNAGNGLLTFTILGPGYSIKKTICFEIIQAPIAGFGVFPNMNDDLKACKMQEIFFTNSSIANNGSNLLYYKWDFGDGSTSSAAFEPSHIYENSGTYEISLTVTNECGCTNIFAKKINVGGVGEIITCPSVVCENDKSTYRVDIQNTIPCPISSNWSIAGGTINYSSAGIVEVLWDSVDENGFGYLTYIPTSCGQDCLEKTTVKIPVIKSIGIIKGKSTICVGNQ